MEKTSVPVHGRNIRCQRRWTKIAWTKCSSHNKCPILRKVINLIELGAAELDSIYVSLQFAEINCGMEMALLFLTFPVSLVWLRHPLLLWEFGIPAAVSPNANFTWEWSLSCFGDGENSLHVRRSSSAEPSGWYGNYKSRCEHTKSEELEECVEGGEWKKWVCVEWWVQRVCSMKKMRPYDVNKMRMSRCFSLHNFRIFFVGSLVGPQASLFRCNHLLCL